MSSADRTLSYADTRPGQKPEGGFPAPYLVLLLDRSRLTALPMRISLAEVEVVTLGRANQRGFSRAHQSDKGRLSIWLDDTFASSEHARLERVDSNRWRLIDCDSKNGTLLNGRQANAEQLSDGDIIEIGNTMMVFRETVKRVLGDEIDVRCDEAPVTPLTTLSIPFARELDRLMRIASAQTPILINGASGTGKELIAREIHARSERTGELVCVNCGAIPAGLVESQLFGHRRGAFSGADRDNPGLIRTADRGTLFLDEIGELAPSAQAALLRTVQEGEVMPVGGTKPYTVDVRIVSATHRDLKARVADGAFREDLYARLAGFTMWMPPLSERREDIGLLIATLIERIAGDRASELQLSRSAARALYRYPWPLNIRELEHALAAAVAICERGEIDLEHLPDDVRQHGRTAPAPTRPAPRPAPPPPEPSMQQGLEPAQDEESHLRDLLALHQGNISAVARDLGYKRTQVHRLLRRYGIDADTFRPQG